MSIQDFRAKYPQYDRVSNDDLSQALHKKFYSHVPFADFQSRFIPGSVVFGVPLSESERLATREQEIDPRTQFEGSKEETAKSLLRGGLNVKIGRASCRERV